MIQRLTYEEVFQLWEKLWPDTKVRPSSSMKYLGGYDSSYYDSKIFFYGWREDDKIVGVNSCFQTGDSFRSRGLYVDEKYRGKDVSQHLLLAVSLTAKINESSFIWSLPRKSVLPVYEKSGFIKTSDFFKNTDYGPNCYVCKKL